MMRTTIYLPVPLHQRLQMASKKQKLSVSKLATDLLDKGLSKYEATKLNELFEAMEKVKGIGKSGAKDTSSKVDEILYGEDGVWKGSDPE